MIENKPVRSLTLAKEILKRGYCVRIPTLGRSMFPLISNIALIEPAKGKDTRVSDIVAYSSKERIVAHRLVRKMTKDGKEILLTKGDTFLECSEVFPKNVIGKVIGVEKWGIKLNLRKGVGKFLNFTCDSTSPILSRAYPILRNWRQWFVRTDNKAS